MCIKYQFNQKTTSMSNNVPNFDNALQGENLSKLRHIFKFENQNRKFEIPEFFQN